MQNHSTAASLPPLPEDGPTEETQVQEVEAKGDQSPIPSANTSHVEEGEGDAVEEVQTEEVATSDHEADAAPPKRRRLAKKVPAAVSSPAKGQDLEDEEESGSPPALRAAPLRVCSTSSTPPPRSSGASAFGGPNFEDLDYDEEEEHRFVSLRMI